MDRVALLVQDVGDFFSAWVAGAVLVDLAAAYGAAWHRGLVLGLLRVPLDGPMVHFVFELVSKRGLMLGAGGGRRAGCADWGAVSPRGLSWPCCCSVSTSEASLVPSPGGVAVLVTWQSWQPIGSGGDWRNPAQGRGGLGPVPEMVAAGAGWGWGSFGGLPLGGGKARP